MSDVNKRTLYCGNLSDKVTEELLFELFLQAGPLESVKIPKDKSGRQKNFAFIVFKHEVSVQYTVALFHGLQLYGRELQLDYRTGTGSGTNPYMEILMAHRRATENPRGGGSGHRRTPSVPEELLAQNTLRGFTTPMRSDPRDFNPGPPVGRAGFPQQYGRSEQFMPTPNYMDSRMMQQQGYRGQSAYSPPPSHRVPRHDYRRSPQQSPRDRHYH